MASLANHTAAVAAAKADGRQSQSTTPRTYNTLDKKTTTYGELAIFWSL